MTTITSKNTFEYPCQHVQAQFVSQHSSFFVRLFFTSVPTSWEASECVKTCCPHWRCLDFYFLDSQQTPPGEPQWYFHAGLRTTYEGSHANAFGAVTHWICVCLSACVGSCSLPGWDGLAYTWCALSCNESSQTKIYIHLTANALISHTWR